MKTIQSLTTAELRRLERIYESGNTGITTLEDSIMLRGIRAEIESRSHLEGPSTNPVLVHH